MAKAFLAEDNVHFAITYGGQNHLCKVTRPALNDRAGTQGTTKLIDLFYRYQAEIEQIALTKLASQAPGTEVIITTSDLNKS